MVIRTPPNTPSRSAKRMREGKNPSAITGNRRPKAYSEIGPLLHDTGILSQEDAKLLRSMAGMRNILVHAYAIIDRDKVLQAAKRLRHDAPRISSTILSGLRKRNVDPEEYKCPKSLIGALAHTLRDKVNAAFLFGGRTKGYELKGDYDIAVLLPEGYSLYDLGSLQIDIAEALNANEEKVDLICLNSAPPEMILEALDGIPIIIKDTNEILWLRTRALMELLDMREATRIINETTRLD